MLDPTNPGFIPGVVTNLLPGDRYSVRLNDGRTVCGHVSEFATRYSTFAVGDRVMTPDPIPNQNDCELFVEGVPFVPGLVVHCSNADEFRKKRHPETPSISEVGMNIGPPNDPPRI